MNSNDPYKNQDFIPPMYDDICPGYNPEVNKNAMRFGLAVFLILIITLILNIIFKPTEPQEKTIVENVECSTIK